MDSVLRAESITLIYGQHFCWSVDFKSHVGKDSVLCDTSWRDCCVTISKSGVLSLHLGLGWNFPKCGPREPHPVLLVLGLLMQALFGLGNDPSTVCRLWAGRSFINKSLLEQSYVHWFVDYLAAFQQSWVAATGDVWPPKPNEFTVWTFKTKFADPSLRK